ncbi:bacillithiol biosynthesis deacetylase BshB1 [Calycomorphotria hydatis]|uniref:1D-myo-inositol 2-acetamido-2-deoxy-alpha-D-glucopyranoside deacetylase n=1 Tax=Calycomorphotria hydatis TaxID=2528027 RepID=A0A517T4B0_9PLAN|nr:bacillithiol biosynthesis deacetylase BshB1 [Calycomorphotria hydatis]QDT63210.1 1D-myo-inositol 2-acetamido-2-deoxy-alpha-D-glucopyranoside deacetylase [Calycomorphotria hydatis]
MIPTPSEPLDLLVVATHPDDAEISVGGTILKLIGHEKKVGVLDLTNGEPTPHGTIERRAKETGAATETLGLHWRHNLGLPNRELVADLEAREKLASVFRITRPKLILAPYWEDAHPDHVAASQLVDAARFWAKLSKTDMPGERFHPPRLLYYFSVHLRIVERASFVVDISDQLDQKMNAIRCYESQVLEGRDETFPTVLDDIQARARYWGWTINSTFGEPLHSREPLGADVISMLC